MDFKEEARKQIVLLKAKLLESQLDTRVMQAAISGLEEDVDAVAVCLEQIETIKPIVEKLLSADAAAAEALAVEAQAVLTLKR